MPKRAEVWVPSLKAAYIDIWRKGELGGVKENQAGGNTARFLMSNMFTTSFTHLKKQALPSTMKLAEYAKTSLLVVATG